MRKPRDFDAKLQALADEARPSFSDGHAALRTALLATAQALRRTTAARHPHHAARARTDTRAWAVTRRERTRHWLKSAASSRRPG